MSVFSRTLKDIIKKKRLTISQISKETGLPTSSLSEWLQGRQPTLSEPVLKLARYLGVSLEYLITGKNIEEQTIEDILKHTVEEYTQIHKGVYRITVEKQKSK